MVKTGGPNLQLSLILLYSSKKNAFILLESQLGWNQSLKLKNIFRQKLNMVEIRHNSKILPLSKRLKL